MIVYHNDHLGTPQKLTAINGAVVWSAVYSSFGKATVDEASTVVNNLRFPGQYFDEESGLHYNWWRYYNPETGRYLKVDPRGLFGGINLYNYALNSPLNLIDSNGLLSKRFRDLVFWTSIADILPLSFIPIIGPGAGITIEALAFFLTQYQMADDYVNNRICLSQYVVGSTLNIGNLTLGVLGNITTPAGDILVSLIEADLLIINMHETRLLKPDPESKPHFEPHQPPIPEPPLPDGYDPTTGWNDTDGDGVPETYTPPGP